MFKFGFLQRGGVDHAVGESGKVFCRRRGILRRGKILSDGFEIPERASTVLYSGLPPGLGNCSAAFPPSTYREKARRICLATLARPVASVNPGSAIMVSRPQSPNQLIAGDDAPPIRLFRKAALYEELIGSEDELPNPGRRLFRYRFVLCLPVLETTSHRDWHAPPEGFRHQAKPPFP